MRVTTAFGRSGRSSHRSRSDRRNRPHGRRLRLEPLEQRQLLTTVQMVADINDSGASIPGSFIEFNGELYFGADDGIWGQEIWKLDSSGDPTQVADINAGPNSANFGTPAVYRGELYFAATDEVYGRSLWKMDAAENASLVADLNPSSHISGYSGATVFNDELYFFCDTDFNDDIDLVFEPTLWKVDAAGNVSEVSTMAVARQPTEWATARLTVFNGEAYFAADDGIIGAELWKIDAAGNVTLAADLFEGSVASSPKYMTVFNGELYFSAHAGPPFEGRELWKLDAVGNASLVANINPMERSDPSHLTVFAGELYFTADEDFGDMPGETFSPRLWKVDASGNASKVLDTGLLLGMVVWNDGLYCSPADATYGYELWSLDASGNASIVEDIILGSTGSRPYNMAVFGNELYFSADDGTRGRELWKVSSEEALFDFGDAPDSYGTTLPALGARHTPTGPLLGATRDAEADGQPTADATGDDVAGAPDDGDGVTVNGLLTRGATTSLTISASGTGIIDAWIDFNQDGAFGGAEKVLGEALTAGQNQVNVSVPADAVLGATFARFRLSTAGGLAPIGAAADGEVEDYQISVEPAPIDLGTVDYRELNGVTVTSEPIWYEFQATRDGLLTVAASAVVHVPDIELTLFDDAGNPLVTADAVVWPQGTTPLDAHIWIYQYRGDTAAVGGNTYFLRVSGEGAELDIRLANLVSTFTTAGPHLTTIIDGTSAPDEYAIDLATNDFAVNGIPYYYSTHNADEINFDGAGGDDSGTIFGTEGDESVILRPGHAEVTVTTAVAVDNTETIKVRSGGGSDEASFFDSPGNDVFTADSYDAWLVGPGFQNASFGFSVNHAYAKSGGEDSASLYGSVGKDYFKANSIYSKFLGPGFYNRAKFFEHNSASGSVNDYARLWDSPSNDTLEGQRLWTRIRNDTWDVTVDNFPQVLVRATEGGHDEAHLTDSDLDDTVRVRTHKTQIYDHQTKGDIYKITIRWFEMMYLEATNGGFDRAKLHDTAGDDQMDATADWARMSQVAPNPRPLYETLGFEIVRAYATEGYDTATWAADQHVDLNGDWILPPAPAAISPPLADAVLEPLGFDGLQ